MGYFDSFTSYFSSSDTTSPPIEAANPDAPIMAPPYAPAFDPATRLSPSYTLKNLSQTNQQLSQPNLPDTQEQMDNLTILADVLEQLSTEVGAFTLLSGFRTQELQSALTAKGEPTSWGTSFHELGRAEDITPTTMGITEFFGRLLANENLKSKFAEIAIKPSQNAIHLAINTPYDSRTPKIMGLNTEGSYAKLSLEDIVGYIKPYMANETIATDYAEAQLVATSNMPMVIMVAALAAGAYFLMGRRKA